MNYAVLEIKTSSGTTTFVNPTAYTTKDTAEAEYHTLCATAAVSTVEVDTVVLIREDGIPIERECFKHEVSNL